MSSDGPSHHLKLVPSQLAGNGGRGRYVLLPGSPGRAKALSEFIGDAPVVAHNASFDQGFLIAEYQRLHSDCSAGPGEVCRREC